MKYQRPAPSDFLTIVIPASFKLPVLRLLAASLVFLGGLTFFAAHAQTEAPGMGRAEFLESLSATEQKIPLQLVVQRRIQLGQPVPEAFRQRASRSRTQAVDAGQVYQIMGVDASTVAEQVRSLGLEPIYVSSGRAYVHGLFVPGPAFFTGVELNHLKCQSNGRASAAGLL